MVGTRTPPAAKHKKRARVPRSAAQKKIGVQALGKENPKAPRKKMETARFESPVINNLRVVGSLDYNGKITRQYRCYATFRKDDSLTAVTAGGGAGSRQMLAPARLYDYATIEGNVGRPFAPPANARIVSFTVAGKTVTDQEVLASLTTRLASIASNASYAIGIQRCPLANASNVEDKASRDTTSAWPVRNYSPVAAPTAPTTQALVDAGGRINGVTTELYTSGGGANSNPYAYFYQYLSPLVQPAVAPLNRHIGVIYEGAETAFKNSGGSAVRYEWNAPPALGANSIVVTNPGLALVLVLSTDRAKGNAMSGTTNDWLTSAPLVDLTLDVTIEVEIDKNNDAQNPQPFAAGAWSAVELQGILE